MIGYYKFKTIYLERMLDEINIFLWQNVKFINQPRIKFYLQMRKVNKFFFFLFKKRKRERKKENKFVSTVETQQIMNRVSGLRLSVCVIPSLKQQVIRQISSVSQRSDTISNGLVNDIGQMPRWMTCFLVYSLVSLFSNTG